MLRSKFSEQKNTKFTTLNFSNTGKQLNMEMIHSVLQAYGVVAKDIQKMEGYGSANYRIKAVDGKQYVLKHYTNVEEKELVKAENKMLSIYGSGRSFEIPKVYLNEKQKRLTENADGSFSRLLSFIEGDFLAEIELTNELFFSLGKCMGELNRAMQTERNSAIEARKTIWDLQYFLLNEPKATFIDNPAQKKIADYFLDQFRQFVLPELPTLRHQIIHNDWNNWNVLANNINNGKVTGVIDFGDICYSPLIHELAVALPYMMFEKENPIAAACEVIKGYHQELPLTEQELKLLYYLIPARLTTSVCNSAEAKTQATDTEYILISEKPAWKLLERWIEFNPIDVQNQFLNAADFPIQDFTEAKKRTSQIRRNHTGKSLSLTYKEPIYMSSAAFQYMYDYNGNTYLDATNNIPHVGHSHPKVSKAISKQTRKLNTNTRYFYDAFADYTEKLLTYFPDDLNQVFYVNSGSAAADLAIRMARAYTQNTHQLVLESGYHGNTQIGIDISSYKFDGKGGSGAASYITQLPLPKLFNGRFATGAEFAEEAKTIIQALIDKGQKPSSYVVEAVSGCGGQVYLALGYLTTLQPFLKENNILLIIDEVQTGFGRMGDYFWGFEQHTFENQTVIPDMVLLGKPIANGHPMGAVVTTQAIADAFANGMEFFSSFGGNPVSLEAAKAVLEVLEEEQLQANAQKVGNYFKQQLHELSNRFPQMADVRGMGLFLGIELLQADNSPYTELAVYLKNALKEHFILVGTDGPVNNVLKIKPPLCFSPKNVDYFCDRLEKVLSAFYK